MAGQQPQKAVAVLWPFGRGDDIRSIEEIIPFAAFCGYWPAIENSD
jgi:hypothetical protein